MPTIKVKRSEGYNCFYCNARAEESAPRCPSCGREFVTPVKTDIPADERPLTERMRARAGSRNRGYVRVVILLALLGVVVLVMWPARRQQPVLPMPTSARPEYRITETRIMPGSPLARLTVVALVRSGMATDSLRAALDWILYSTLDEQNREQHRTVRIIWAYLLEDPALPASGWRAMAIWVDPKLPAQYRPAGAGGDAVHAGPVEYDFTNPSVKAGQK